MNVIEEFQMDLPGYGAVPCDIVLSNRVKRFNLRVTTERKVLVVVSSIRVIDDAKAFLYRERAWVLKHLRHVSKMMGNTENVSAVPDFLQNLNFAYFNETWTVNYEWMPIREIGYEIQREKRNIRIFGAILSHPAVMMCLQKALGQLALMVLRVPLTEWAAKMNLSFGKVSTRFQKKRWGSCSSRNDISLNAQLLFFPPDIVEYVLIHELCHIVEHNHSAAFWALVKKYCPDYEQREARQRQMEIQFLPLFSKFTK